MAGKGKALKPPRTEARAEAGPSQRYEAGASPTPEGLESLRQRIRTLVAIAADNHSTMSSEELRVLLPPTAFADADAVSRFIQGDRVLHAELVVAGREVGPRADPGLLESRQEQRRLTDHRLRLAESFAAGLQRWSPGLELVAISGSVAYGGTKVDDDIDFYIVTGAHGLWITLLLAMGLSRIQRLRNPGTPVFCFNRLEESGGCRARFRDSREPLFAREALSLRVLRGGDFYRDLLDSASWMQTWFPSLYGIRLEEAARYPRGRSERGSPFRAAANAAAFLALGPYLWAVGAIRNVRLRRDGRTKAVFRTVVEPTFCAYESRKFEDLDQEYRRMFA